MLSAVLPFIDGRPEEVSDLWAWLLPSWEDILEEVDDRDWCRQ
jgi:hypothetical protein